MSWSNGRGKKITDVKDLWIVLVPFFFLFGTLSFGVQGLPRDRASGEGGAWQLDGSLWWQRMVPRLRIGEAS